MTTTERASFRAPSKLLTALEIRAVPERLSMEILNPLLRLFPQGDGHSVLFLPGFTTTDRSTRPMRNLFYHLGYRTYRWRLGRNKGPTERIAPGLERIMERVAGRADGPVSIVGWSLGGVYARELARRYPTDVRQVITLGSPIQMMHDDESGASAMWDFYSPRHVNFFRFDVPEPQRPSLTMPSTSIFTRTDGIVYWKACLLARDQISENVEVWGSHSGLGFNASALYAVADRLSQPKGEWQPFKVPLAQRALYPCQRY